MRTPVLQGGKQLQGAALLHSLTLFVLLNVLRMLCFEFLVHLFFGRGWHHVILCHMKSLDTRLEKQVGNRNIENKWLVLEESKS